MYRSLRSPAITKAVSVVLAVAIGCASAKANAWFFFFIPHLGSHSSDANADNGEVNCVKATAKVGDVIRSASGNTATVKSVSGKSSRCQDSSLPIGAVLEFNFVFSAKAGIDVPEDYEEKPLTDVQRFQGNLLHAENRSQNTAFFLSATRRDQSSDAAALAQNISTRMKASLEEGTTSNEEDFQINGLHALRFQLAGESKAMFHPKFTYLVTIVEGPEELVGCKCLLSYGRLRKEQAVAT
jgi:hypothetical protein